MKKRNDIELITQFYSFLTTTITTLTISTTMWQLVNSTQLYVYIHTFSFHLEMANGFYCMMYSVSVHIMR